MKGVVTHGHVNHPHHHEPSWTITTIANPWFTGASTIVNPVSHEVTTTHHCYPTASVCVQLTATGPQCNTRSMLFGVVMGIKSDHQFQQRISMLILVNWCLTVSMYTSYDHDWLIIPMWVTTYLSLCKLCLRFSLVRCRQTAAVLVRNMKQNERRPNSSYGSDYGKTEVHLTGWLSTGLWGYPFDQHEAIHLIVVYRHHFDYTQR